MYRVLLISSLIGVVFSGAITQQGENANDGEKSDVASVNRPEQLQTYPSLQGSYSPSYYYPSYTEYSNTGIATTRGGSEGYYAPDAIQPKHNWSARIITSLIPLTTNLMSYVSQMGTSLIHFVFAVFLGSLLTTLMCTFTPLCAITFTGLALTKSQVKEQVAELARMYITPESLNAATVLVSKAVDKYSAMQREKREQEKQ